MIPGLCSYSACDGVNAPCLGDMTLVFQELPCHSTGCLLGPEASHRPGRVTVSTQLPPAPGRRPGHRGPRLLWQQHHQVRRGKGCVTHNTPHDGTHNAPHQDTHNTPYHGVHNISHQDTYNALYFGTHNTSHSMVPIILTACYP